MSSWKELYAEKAIGIITNTSAWAYDPSYSDPRGYRYLPGKVELVHPRNVDDHLSSNFALDFEVSVRYKDPQQNERSTGLVYFWSRGWSHGGNAGAIVYVAKKTS